MAKELVEVTEVLDHPLDRVWSLLTDLESYPRFVAEVAWCEPIDDPEAGRYEVRFSVDQGPVVRQRVEILVNRPGEHLVLVSDRWPGGHVSLKFEPLSPTRTEVQLSVSLPNVESGITGNERELATRETSFPQPIDRLRLDVRHAASNDLAVL